MLSGDGGGIEARGAFGELAGAAPKNASRNTLGNVFRRASPPRPFGTRQCARGWRPSRRS